MTDRPNFLYIMTDQHRSDWLGCAGHPVVKTPNIDALAATGTRFADFHAASPICMPNRASFMTGRMPSLHGLRYNGLSLPERATTFVEVLAKAGYDTANIGKSHHQPFTGLKATHPNDPPGTADRLIEEALPDDAPPSAEAPEEYETREPRPFPNGYYGYAHVDMVTSHGDRCGGHYKQWLQREHPEIFALWAEDAELPHDYTCPQARRTPIPEAAYPTTWIADRAIDYLKAPERQNAPFFSFVSFPDPHHPFNPPGKYWDMYDPEDFDMELPPEAHQNPTPPMQWLDDAFAGDGGQLTPQTVMRMSKRHHQEAMALTAGMITMIDDQIGRIINALKDAGLYENTVIVFNSDHGDYLGDFGLVLKGMLPFRSITQVPMIWSDPAERTARVTQELASTIDISATILERCGLTPFRGMQGRSFMDALSGGAHRKDVLIEFNDGVPKLGFDTPARVRTLRSKHWRFSIYADQEWGELYDLEADPNETNNLWESPDHLTIRGELALTLAHRMARAGEESPRSTWLA